MDVMLVTGADGGADSKEDEEGRDETRMERFQGRRAGNGGG
jgi:hypothetical protein